MSQSYNIAVFPDAPDPASLLVGEANPTYRVHSVVWLQQGTMPELYLSWATITARTACAIWAQGYNLLDDLDNGYVDNSVNPQTCDALVPLDTRWDLDVNVTRFDAVDLIAD